MQIVGSAISNFRLNLARLLDGKMSQAELADRAEISRVYLNRLLTGYRGQSPTIEICERLAKALSVSIEDLIADPPKNLRVKNSA